MSDGHVRLFRYVVHSLVESYRAQGWVVVSLLPASPHEHYAVLMELPNWPPEPCEQTDAEIE